MKALPHGFDNSQELTEMAQILGYMRCLTHISTYVKENTFSNWAIDSQLLIDSIYDTTIELKAIVDSEKDVKSILDNLTKSIPL